MKNVRNTNMNLKKGNKRSTKLTKKFTPRFKVRDAFSKFEEAVNSHLEVNQQITSD